MSKWQEDDRPSPKDPAQQTTSEDRLPGGITLDTWELWKGIYARAVEYLHKQENFQDKTPSADELLQETEKHRALYEYEFGLRVVPERPHEYAFALILRPFSRPALNGEIPFITESRLSPGYCFIGLEREGEPAVPAGSLPSHRIASAADLKAAIDIAAAARPNGFVFFQAADHMWKDVVIKFADFSAAILVDLSESTHGLEWEFETLVPKYRQRFVCYAINAESRPFGPWQEHLPAGLEVHPIVSRLGQTVARRMFSDLLRKRIAYDKAVVNKQVVLFLSKMPWGQDFIAGLEALSDGKVDKASKRLQLAWDCATGITSHPLGLVYPGIALADTLTLTGDRAKRYSVLERVLRVAGSPRPSTGFEQFIADVRLIRQLLALKNRELPLAIWQFYAVLGGGLSSELSMAHHFQMTVQWEEKMGRPETDSSREMLSWHADETVRLARQLKHPFIEVDALYSAAAARKTLGDVAGFLERARAGAELAVCRGNTAMATRFASLLDSGA